MKPSKGPVIIYRHGGGGGGFGGGGHLIFGGTNGGSPETLKGFREGTTQIFLENEGMHGWGEGMGGGGGGNRESYQMLFSEVRFKGGIG